MVSLRSLPGVASSWPRWPTSLPWLLTMTSRDAVDAAEEGVVGGLDAGFADDVAGRVEGVAVVIGEHLLGDLADVADEVGGEAVAGIEAALLVEGFEFGELVAMGGDEGLLVGSDVLLEGNGLVFGGDLVAADGGLNLLDGDVEAAGDEGKIGVEVLDLFAEEVAGDGGVVVDEEAAFAVEELAARGEDGNFADAVGFGEGTEVVGAEHLKAPEAGEEDDENQRDEILGGVELADGQLLGFAGWDRWSGLRNGGLVPLLNLSLRLGLPSWLYHCCVSRMFVRRLDLRFYSRRLVLSSRKKMGRATAVLMAARRSSWSQRMWKVVRPRRRRLMRKSRTLLRRKKPKFMKMRVVRFSTST